MLETPGQSRPDPLESLLDGLPVEIGSSGDPLGAHLLPVVEVDEGSGGFGQGAQAVVEGLELLRPGVTGTLADLVESRIQMGDDLLLAMKGEPTVPSVVHEDVVSGDPPQPGAEEAGLIESVQNPPGGDHGLLVDVLDGPGILHLGPNEGQKHRGMFPDEDLECGAIVLDGGAPGAVLEHPLSGFPGSGTRGSSDPTNRYPSMMPQNTLESIHATTIVCVRDEASVAIAGDGQVTLGAVVAKSSACKIRRLDDVGHDRAGVLVGFAGGASDAFALLERFESKLKATPTQLLKATAELARDWRTDRALRRLEAMMIVADLESMLIVSGQGDLIEPDDGIAAIGSGGHYALAAARALKRRSDLPASEVATESMQVAGEICIYTNTTISLETLTRQG